MSLLIPGDEMPNAGTGAVPWLCEPYIPREGIVFLYGKKGVGKSPCTWALARAVALGEPWLGLKTEQGQVLYIEVDSPLSVVKARTDHMTFPSNLWFYFPQNALLCTQEGYSRMVAETKHLSPALVIVNTLRKIHTMRDTESDTVAKVYALFRKLWPCILFVHHEKKTPTNPEHAYEQGEEFSGALAWHNDAQVCLNLRHAAGRPPAEGYNLLLVNTGNQLHEQPPPLRLYLAPNGYDLSPRNTPRNTPEKP